MQVKFNTAASKQVKFFVDHEKILAGEFMKQKIPKVLDVFVDKVLRFKPKPRSKAAKKRVAGQIKFVAQPERKKAAD
jgi:hypothetical protein